MKNPTLKEKVSRYEEFLHKINVCLISGNNEAIGELIQNADNWSYAHRRGEFFTDKERDKMINSMFWKLLDTPKADAIVAERQKKWKESQKQKEVELISDEELIALANQPKYGVYHKPTKLWVYFREYKDKLGILVQSMICLCLKVDATVSTDKEHLKCLIKMGEFNGDSFYGKENFSEFRIKKI